MSKHAQITKTASLLLFSSAIFPAAVTPSGTRSSADVETVMKEADHKKVGELMGACIEAFLAREGRREAEEELSDTIKKKWSKNAKPRDPMALSDDLAASLWYAIDYTKVKGIKKGKIEDLPVTVDYYYLKDKDADGGKDYVATSAIWTPKKYTPKSKYPLLLCIPDPDEKPEAHLNDHWMHSELRDSVILVAVDMPDGIKHWGGLGEAGSHDNAGGAGVLLATFAEVRDNFAIDFDQVFLAGRGAGVAAAMNIANLFPDRFCAIIGRTGDAAEVAPENLSNLPCFFAGGGKLANDFSALGEGDNRAERVFKPDGKVEDIWAWMQTVRRRSNPEEVSLVPGVPFPYKAYWTEVPAGEYTSTAKLSARADRASNTITIKATGIESVTVFLNDTLVDLDKPVKVICNGASHEDKIPRNFNSMMEQIYKGRSDPGRLYTAWKVYDIPAAAKDAE